jgi:hypothetical protein
MRPKAGGFLAGGFHRWQRRTARPAEPDHEKTKPKNQNSVRSAAHRLPQCDNWGRLGSEQPSRSHVPSCGGPYSTPMRRRSISIWNDKACHCEQQPILPLCDQTPYLVPSTSVVPKANFCRVGSGRCPSTRTGTDDGNTVCPTTEESLTRQCGKDRSKRKH